MILDANILLYAIDSRSPQHDAARSWFEAALNGDQRVGLPWQTIGAFLRIVTHPRIVPTPLDTATAQGLVDDWLAVPVTWVPPSSARTVAIYSTLARAHHVTGNLVPDAQLAALAIEHGTPLISADTDFARFPEIRWINPLTP